MTRKINQISELCPKCGQNDWSFHSQELGYACKACNFMRPIKGYLLIQYDGKNVTEIRTERKKDIFDFLSKSK